MDFESSHILSYYSAGFRGTGVNNLPGVVTWNS